MKNTLTFVFLICSLFSFSQENKDCEIISRTTCLQIKGDKLVKTDSVLIQINNRLGDPQTEINIYYQKGDKVSVDEAWIEDMEGNIIRKLKKNEIKDESAVSNSSLYQDDFVKSFELKLSSYPYRVFYTYKKTYSNFLSIFSSKISIYPLRSQKVVVETTSDRAIKYKQKNMDDPVVETTENMIRYTWNYNYKGYKPEINAWYDASDFPELKIVPQNFKYGKDGSFDNWETFGNWLYRLNEGRDILTEAEKFKVNQLVIGIEDDREKARILYKYMQDNTRYINVSLKLGGLQTYPAEYVCEKKYGDCKALVNYMKAMLKYVEIESYNTPIYMDDKVEDVDLDFASSEFNHVILTVPLQGDTIFLECTDKNMLFGYIHSSIQGRKALLSKESGSKLISVPQMKSEDVLCARRFDVTIDTNIRESDIKLIAKEKGYTYELFTYLDVAANKNQADKYIRNNILSGSFTLTDYKFSKEGDDASITVDMDCKMQNVWKRYGNNLVFIPFPIRTKAYEAPENRKFGVQIDYPFFRQDTIVYDVKNITISKIPQNVTIESPFGHYKQEFILESDSKLILRKSVLINAGKYSLSDYNKFYEFIKAIKNNENKNIYLEVL